LQHLFLSQDMLFVHNKLDRHSLPIISINHFMGGKSV
jgi:hypothetical protein